MSSELLLKGFFVGIISLMFTWVVFSGYNKEIGSENVKNQEQEEEGRGDPYAKKVSASLWSLTRTQNAIQMLFMRQHFGLIFLMIEGPFELLFSFATVKMCANTLLILRNKFFSARKKTPPPIYYQ